MSTPDLTLALGGALAPLWIVAPLGVVTLLVVSGHVLGLWRAEMPASRRRIRIANGLLMMMSIPLGVYAMSVADPAVQKREFLLSWMMIVGLVTLVLALAAGDILNNWRLYFAEKRRLAREVHESVGRDAADAPGSC
ncbi:MAG: hypothetical protein DYG92_00100 [Leptolyngbya sp. PLA1]|nr:hypothetical protein [Leptolyngbya sp. PLA1]